MKLRIAKGCSQEQIRRMVENIKDGVIDLSDLYPGPPLEFEEITFPETGKFDQADDALYLIGDKS